jgi:predicted 3-demethylubiquinone-9 3-methyltransferase (glyoxalase superfamily)
MNKITPFLWLDNNAEQAAEFYLAIFPHARKWWPQAAAL